MHAHIHADIYMRAVTWPGQEAPKAFGCVAACNIYIYIYIYIYIHTYTHVHTDIYTCMHTYIHG